MVSVVVPKTLPCAFGETPDAPTPCLHQDASTPPPSQLSLLNEDRCFTVLVGVRDTPEPFGMLTFTRASGLTGPMARRARDTLEACGLLQVERPRKRGAVRGLQMRLTPAGRRAADNLFALDLDLRSPP